MSNTSQAATTILVVDDEPVALEFCRATLTRAGYKASDKPDFMFAFRVEAALPGPGDTRSRQPSGAPITGASMTALQTIERLGPIAMSKLAERLELDQSTLSRQVRPLEEEGLVTRTADANDRRVARLASTAKGSTLLHRMRDVSLNDYDVALRDWPATDRAQLAALLDRFRRALLDVRVDRWGWSVDVAGE